jgi:phosphate-selective porin
MTRILIKTSPAILACGLLASTARAQDAEPLAGFSDGAAFLRSADNQFQFFPNGRLQVDGFAFKSENKVENKTLVNTFLLKRARLELAGWVGPMFFFSIAGDFAAGAPAGANPAAQANLNTTDDYVAVAPWGDAAILQVGQFDAPFTLENRTSDKYFDFMERAIAVRAFGIPSNKEVGAMIHGLLPSKLVYYSLGVFNGDGQNFRNADDQFDVIGRAWIAPLALSQMEALKSITLGGSVWTGKRVNGLPSATQTTQGGFAFWAPKWTSGTTTYELHQHGRLNAYALELNAPVAHRFGLRAEWVKKHQQLSEADVSKAGTTNPIGLSALDGWAGYGELWFWAVGDDRIIGDPGLQLPPRFKKFGTKTPQHGLMLALKVDYLTEELTENARSAALNLGSPVLGTTKVTAFTVGVNYWYSKRFRATFDYVRNSFDGDTKFVKGLAADSEQEFLFRLAIAL